MEEDVAKVVWVLGDDLEHQEFLEGYLKDRGYISRIFISAEDCLELLLPGHDEPEMIMILDSLYGEVSPDKARRVLKMIRPEISILQLSTEELVEMEVKKSSQEVKPNINPALKRLTDAVKKISGSGREDR